MPSSKLSLGFAFVAALGLFGGCTRAVESAQQTTATTTTTAENAGAEFAPAQATGKEQGNIGFPYKAKPESMKAFQDARFGMFLHWGPVSLTGKELSWARKGGRGVYEPEGNDFIPAAEYDQLYQRFDPVQFDADEYVRIAQDAGMRYMIITAKHHDGFSMFDTKLSDYSIMNTPYGKDIVKQLADACHRAEMGFGVYYSIRDWYHPDYLTDNHANYNKFFMGQIDELMSNYGKIDVMWFDSVGRDTASYPIEDLIKLIRAKHPDIVINNRIANAVNMLEPQPELPEKYTGDFDTPEHTIGQYQVDRPWESCITIVGKQWSFLPDGPLMSLDECIKTLVQCATGGGNLLLNIGPMPDGRIEPRQADRLKEVGDWLKINGESIYGTRGGPFPPEPWGSYSQSEDAIYVHVMDWTKGPIDVPISKHRIKGVELIGGGTATASAMGGITTLDVPEADRKSPDTIIKISLNL